MNDREAVKLGDLINQIIVAIGNCHDGGELWSHLRRDPEAFRHAVRGVLAIEISLALKAERERVALWHESAANRADSMAEDGINLTGVAYEHRISAQIIREDKLEPLKSADPPKYRKTT